MKSTKRTLFRQRILQVFLQILLLLLSAIVSITGAWVVWLTLFCIVNAIITGDSTTLGIAPFAGLFANAFTWPIAIITLQLMELITKKELNRNYVTEGHEYTYEATVSHDIYDRSGTVIGSYDTTETKTGYTGSLGIHKYLFYFTCLFPCRIITLIAAILACFTDYFYVSAKVPKENCEYNKFLHKYFDIVVIESDENEQISNSTPISSTLITLIPIIILIFVAFLIIDKPLFILKNISLEILLTIYIISILFCIVAAMVERRRIYKVILVLGLVIVLFSLIVAVSSLNTITISTVSDFEDIVNIPRANERNYELVADLDFNGESSSFWGLFDNFTGTFNGNNHTISNISITAKSIPMNCGTIYIFDQKNSFLSSSIHGFGFIQMNNGTIENIRFDQIDITVQQKDNFYNFVGIVAAYNRGTINNCLVTNCSIRVTGENEKNCYVGGIVGYDDQSTISNVALINAENDTLFDVTSKNHYIGGIAGESYQAAHVTNVFVYQNIKNTPSCIGIIGITVFSDDELETHASSRNCVDSFDAYIISAYAKSIKSLVHKTTDTPIFNLTDLPDEMEDWVYFEAFDSYLPCYGFDYS